MEAAHAPFGPSAAHKWMRCAGALAMEEGLPDSITEYSDEGTAAHELAKWCLQGNKDAAAFEGRVLRIINGVYWPGGKAKKPPLAKGHKRHIDRQFEVTEEMAAHVQRYADSVREYAAGKTLLVEERLDISAYVGVPKQWGTGDAVILDDAAEEIQAHDLKYGKGTKVDPFENEQGMLYALGAYWMFGMLGDFKRVRIVIHQPRMSDAPTEWDINIADLLAFAGRAKAAARVAIEAFEIKKTDPKRFIKGYLEPGDKQCKFCKAKAVCPKRTAGVAKTIIDEFEDLDGAATFPQVAAQVVAIKSLPALPSDLDALAALYPKLEAIEDWCRAVAATFEARLLNGEQHPHWKAVAGKKGNRAWTDEAEAENTLKLELSENEMYTRKLITPTAAEKVLKTPKPESWKKVAALIKQADGKPTIAPIDDKRPAIVITPAIEEFEDLTKGEQGNGATDKAA